jgi:hypothetical protein
MTKAELRLTKVVCTMIHSSDNVQIDESRWGIE